MLSQYLSSYASWKRRSGTDRFGAPVFGSESTVSCRREAAHTLDSVSGGTSPANSERRDSSTVYYLLADVAPGDMLDGKIVTSVEAWESLGGVLVGRKARV